MTIDERLDRLTERHEALTQSVELILMAQNKTERMLADVVGAIHDLASIAKIHESRLDHLEGN